MKALLLLLPAWCSRHSTSTACGMTSALVVVSALDFATPVDARPGSSWGDTGAGVSCTAACQADGGKECDGAAFVDVTNQAKFDEASSMACGGGYMSTSGGSVPFKYTRTGSSYTNKCFYGTGGTCDATNSGTRVCPCKCGAKTYQPSTGIVTACPR